MLAGKSPYVQMAYGASRPGRPGTPIHVAEGANVGGITLRLPRGAVVTGIIHDQAGEPIADVSIIALRVSGDSAVVAGSALTDNEGSYRIFGLAPGRYMVAAMPRLADTGPLSIPSVEEMDGRFAALERPGLTLAGGDPESSVPAKSGGYAPQLSSILEHRT